MAEGEGNPQEAPNPQPAPPPVIPEGYIPASEKNSAAAAARREGEDEGKTKRERELMERYGVESLEDLDAAVKAAKDKADAEKTAQDKLTERETELSSVKEERKTFKERAERAEGALKVYLDTEREGLPEHIITLLDKMDPVDQLSYISDNREHLKPEEKKENRAPDANNRPNPGEKARGADRLRAMNW